MLIKAHGLFCPGLMCTATRNVPGPAVSSEWCRSQCLPFVTVSLELFQLSGSSDPQILTEELCRACSLSFLI